MYCGNTDELIGMAREKQSLIEKFLQLTEEQSAAINSKNYDSMFNIINEKQSIIERVNLLDLELNGITPEDRNVIGEIVEATREIMSRAIALDKKNIRLLKENQAEISEKLKNVRKKKKGHYMYRGKNVAVEGILLDQKK